MQRCVLGTLCLLGLLLAGCNEANQEVAEANRKAAEELATRQNAEREQQAVREKERLAEENRLRQELKADFDLLLGHWDHPSGKGPSGKPLSIHLEITSNECARFHMVCGISDSSTECPIRLTSKDGQRVLVQGDGPSQLKLPPLAYRLEGDKLILTGTATDVLLKEVDLSGEWRRTDWTKRSEAEIADTLKKLDANLVYDENSPGKPIVQVAFAYQAPVHNAHLRLFVGLRQLQELDLSAVTQLSDAGLKHLVPLRQLKTLNLTGLPLSNEAVQELARELPNCHIIH